MYGFGEPWWRRMSNSGRLSADDDNEIQNDTVQRVLSTIAFMIMRLL